MLILSRRLHERIRLRLPDGTTIWIGLAHIKNHQAAIAIDAPPGVDIRREELLTPRTIPPAE